MNSVKVDKGRLIERLTANKTEHERLYALAVVGYHEALTRWFAEQLAAVREASHEDAMKQRTSFPGSAPASHASDYAVVLDMLDMEVGDTITLTHQEFQQYVRDDWGWKAGWTTSNAGYVGEHGEFPR